MKTTSNRRQTQNIKYWSGLVQTLNLSLGDQTRAYEWRRPDIIIPIVPIIRFDLLCWQFWFRWEPFYTDKAYLPCLPKHIPHIGPILILILTRIWFYLLCLQLWFRWEPLYTYKVYLLCLPKHNANLGPILILIIPWIRFYLSY